MAAELARSFLGSDAPFLRALAKELLGPTFHGGLGNVVVVLPGRRASRRLLEHLAIEAAGVFEPPRIITEAGLAQALSTREFSIASPLAVECAWLEVVSDASQAELAPFVPRASPSSDVSSRLGLARQFAALDRERIREAWTVSDPLVAGDPRARERIEAVARLSARASAVLERAGLVDPLHDLEEVDSSASRRPEVQVVLAGIVELSAAQRSFLAALAPPPRVIVHADPEDREGFDELGCLIPEFWERREIPLSDGDWCAVDDPAAGARAAADWLSALPRGTSVDEVSLGVLGLELVPGLQRTMEERGLFLHVAAGVKARLSPPWRALSALHEWIVREDFSALAGLVRHADVEAAIRVELPDAFSKRDPPGDLDRWHVENLPDALDGEWSGAAQLLESASRCREGLRKLCGALASKDERPLADWLTELTQTLCRLHPTLPDADAPGSQLTRAALESFAQVALEIESACARGFVRPISAAVALRLWLDWTADRELPATARSPALETLGWLELALEEAPFVCLLGFNEGWLPEAERTSRLVDATRDDPNSRTSQRTRLARDVHALSMLARARGPGALRAISLRSATAGDPLKPSRLLFRCDDDRAIARARRFFEVAPAAARAIVAAESEIAKPKLAIPRLPPIEKIAVTSFKLFLESPYHFYLQKVLGLERVRDDAWEMDAAAFGSMAHAVLRSFGASDERHSTDAGRIEDFAIESLGALAREQFGASPKPAVRLQLQQLKRRLEAFACAQAEQAKSGWRIDAVEFDLRDARLVVDDAPILIRGVVDRLDRHEASGAWRVLDYKTGASSDDPRAAHRTKKGKWRDLQLPLYDHFLRRQLRVDALEMGYFSLPTELGRTGVFTAEFSAEELDDALNVACEQIRKIRAGRFDDMGSWHPRERVERAVCGLSSLLPVAEIEALEQAEGDESAEALGFETP